jgi:hypothetical protein
VGDVVDWMRSFKRMSKAFINQLYRYEARAPVPNEGSLRTANGNGISHRELEEVKFIKFMGVTDGSVAEAWLENTTMCFALRDYTSNMKVHMEKFQLKESALVSWKTFLPKLNMVIEDMSWEIFEDQF